MAEEMTTAQALDEARRWLHSMRAGHRLVHVLDVVVKAEALVADGERALSESNKRFVVAEAEVANAQARLADVRHELANEQFRLTAAKDEAKDLAAAHVKLRAAEERKTREHVESLVATVTMTEVEAMERKHLFDAEIAALLAQRDAIKAEIDDLRRKVMGVGA